MQLHQPRYRYSLVWQTPYFDSKIWQQTRYFNVDFDSNGLFLLYISDKYLQFRKKKYINLDNQFHYKKYNEKDRHISKTFVFIFRHSIQHEASGYTFYKKEKHLLWKIFGSPHISKWIFLLRNCFSNYVYLNNMYITLKGIGKIVLVSVLKTLLICKFLNFMAAFTKKIKLSKVCIQFSV